MTWWRLSDYVLWRMRVYSQNKLIFKLRLSKNGQVFFCFASVAVVDQRTQLVEAINESLCGMVDDR